MTEKQKNSNIGINDITVFLPDVLIYIVYCIFVVY